MNPKHVAYWLLGTLVCTFSLTPAGAEEPQVYVAVVSNKSFTVGAKNAGSGLFVGDLSGGTWRNLAFSNMRTFSVEVLPHIGSGLIYTANGNGVIISRDGGKTWRVTTGWEITEVLKIAANPQNPATVYIGTAYGAYKSVDFGETWQQLTHRYVYSLHLDVQDTSRIYVGEEDRLLVSTNAGRSFRRTGRLSLPVLSLAQDPQEPDILFLGTEDDGLFVSRNRGKSWRQVGTAPVTATVYQILIDEHDPRRIFAATFAHGVLISHDGGRSWMGQQKTLQGMPVFCIALHPQDRNTLFAGTQKWGIVSSEDGGKTWKPFGLDGTYVMEIEIR